MSETPDGLAGSKQPGGDRLRWAGVGMTWAAGENPKGDRRTTVSGDNL